MTRQAAFTLLFWGMLFQLVNLYVQGINLLPDAVGLILTAVAAHRLRTDNDHFDVVFRVSLPMIFLSLPNIHHAVAQPSGFHVSTSTGGMAVGAMSFISWCLAFVLVFHLCKGVEEMANERDEPELARQSTLRWQMFLALQAGVALAVLFGWLHAVPLAAGLGLMVIIYSLVVAIAFLVWLWHCRSTLA